MTLQHDQKGFGHIVLPLFVLAVLVIGFSAYEVFHANKAATTSTTASTTAATTANVPATIKSQSDLKQAADALNTSNQQMQTQLNSTSLDSSINQLL
jgi:zona occludens toxin (predicted ATPase)